ncbi:MAG: ATP-binding protein [Spirochaetaceae bacterium]|nr:ATP-binding protein [Spirochaetaceae bacterium]
MAAPAQRLFTPGDGAAPPALTGREREEALLLQCLADLLGGTAPPHNVALMGPRGNGKTVLLKWFERACRHAGRVDIARLSPSRIRTEQALVDLLLPGATHAPSPQNLTERLIARCRTKPLVVLLDEAHTLAPDVGELLLNVSQEVRAEAPFLLVLAGTPGLPAHLGTMDASFWSRLSKGRLGIGLLGDAAARAALTEPLAAHGVDIEADTLTAVVEESQRYPYFIQVWGEALWDELLATGATRLTAAHADAARPNVIARVTDYHQDRYRELEAGALLPAAVAVAALLQAGAASTASDHAVDAALAETGAEAAERLEAREALNRLGYIWSPPGQLPPVVWIAGIPSLMAHVLDHTPPLPAAGALA